MNRRGFIGVFAAMAASLPIVGKLFASEPPQAWKTEVITWNDSLVIALVPVRLTPDDGGYFAEAVNLRGCVSQGDTKEEALRNISEALQGCIEAYHADGQQIPWDGSWTWQNCQHLVTVRLPEAPTRCRFNPNERK